MFNFLKLKNSICSVCSKKLAICAAWALWGLRATLTSWNVWKDVFSNSNCLKAWRVKFTHRVYWELLRLKAGKAGGLHRNAQGLTYRT